MRMPFGEYKGEPLRELAEDYLWELVHQQPAGLIEHIEAELERRRIQNGQCSQCAGCGKVCNDDYPTPWRYWPVLTGKVSGLSWHLCPVCDGDGLRRSDDGDGLYRIRFSFIDRERIPYFGRTLTTDYDFTMTAAHECAAKMAELLGSEAFHYEIQLRP